MVVQDEVLQGKVRRGQLHSGRGAEEESLRRSQSQRSCRNVNPCPMFFVNLFMGENKHLISKVLYSGQRGCNEKIFSSRRFQILYINIV